MNEILNYFGDLSKEQIKQLKELYSLYQDWNEKINVVSRKDFENFYIHHVLHSLAIAKFIKFKAGTAVLDLGAGGGFPSIPLAILFPDVEFLAVDSIAKKIKIIDDILEKLNLKNLNTEVDRVENIQDEFDFVVTRAVARLDKLIAWSKPIIHPISFNSRKNGLIALKGGDLQEEILETNKKVTVQPISEYFREPYFETKSIIYIPL